MKVLVGISGGVDSAYTALKLMREGHIVEGAILKMHEYSDLDGALRVAQSLGIALRVVDMTELFNNIIKKDLVECYLGGKTPNPCILCNELVKFKGLYDIAVKEGFDYIATGHYARVVKYGDRYAVAAATDTKKDQSYMLYRLPQEILSMLILPLSETDKEEVRRLSADAGIPVANKKDSQEICFLPDGNYAEYIESMTGECPQGNFISTEGEILGRHKGIIRYTVGQRKGLGIALGERVFVTDIDPVANTVTLSPTMRGRVEFEIERVVFSGMEKPGAASELSLNVKLRYTAPPIPVKAVVSEEGRVILRFDSEVIAAPGQSAVLYNDGKVMFGGFICP